MTSPSDRPTQSVGLKRLYALIAAANAAGVMAERYKADPNHPERVATYKHFVECEERMKLWVEAIEKTTDVDLGHGGALPFGRAGDPSRIRVIDDESTPTGREA